MNILIIGNGFDLAHGLETKYGDFLKCTAAFKRYKDVCKQESIEKEWNDAEDKEYILHFANMYEKNRKYFDELETLILKNVWISYFEDIFESRRVLGKDGWIDFESEISNIIQTMDEAKKTVLVEIHQGKECGKMTQRQLDILNPLISPEKTSSCDNRLFEEKFFRYWKDKLLKQLNDLIRCLEIYLSYFVEYIEYEKENELTDIQNLPILDKVLSFNYTHTYQKKYDENMQIEYDYIHGEAILDRQDEKKGIVLGIDEYLGDERKNIELDFIEFKKYYQRIYKQNGCLYREWIDEIKTNNLIQETTSIGIQNNEIFRQKRNVNYHKLFIYGHSLDITDKDILREFILNDNVQTTIFYLDRKDFGQKIINLVKIIGQDELIKRTGGKTKTISFQIIDK